MVSGAVVRIHGRLDADAAMDFERALAGAIETDLPRIIVDMADVDYICSACLRVIVKITKLVQSKDNFIELIRTKPEVKKVLMVVGFDELLPLGEGSMQIIDVLKQTNHFNVQAMRNARFFLMDLFNTFGIENDSGERIIQEIFNVFSKESSSKNIEEQLKEILVELNLGKLISETLKERASKIYKQISPYIDESGSIIDVGCGDGRIAQAFVGGDRKVQLIDTIDYNMVQLPFQRYDGVHIPFPDKSFDYSFAITVLHHCDQPLEVLKEMKRVTRKRLVIIESVYLNEAQRRFNMFFDWFYNRVLHDDVNVPYNFNSPEGWEHIFREDGLNVAASVDIGLDQVTVPEYHWLYVLEPAQ